MACADIQTLSAGTDGSEKEQNSKNPELSEPNIQNTVKAVDSKARPPENNKFVYIDEKDITLTEECLGKGSFGKVLKGKMKENNKDIEVAVKVFDSSEDLFKRFRREMQLLGNVSHPNIVQFKGMVKTGGRTEKYVMELMSSTLMEYLVDRGKHDRLHTKLSFLLDIAKVNICAFCTVI